jgi:hypothetical protein
MCLRVHSAAPSASPPSQRVQRVLVGRQVAGAGLRQPLEDLLQRGVVEQAHRLARQHQRTVVAGATHQGVEFHVERHQFGQAGLGGAGIDVGLQLGQVVVGGLAGGQAGGQRLQCQGHVPQFLEGGLVQQQQAGGARRQIVYAGQADEQAPAFTPLQQAFLLDLADGLAHRAAVHAEAVGQFLLGGQGGTGAQCAVEDGALDGRRHRLVGRLDHHALEHLGPGLGVHLPTPIDPLIVERDLCPTNGLLEPR